MKTRGPAQQTFADKLIRQRVRHLRPYVPGEQPAVRGLVKLNTNENPRPPAPAVLKAVKAAVDGRLRLYPNPSAEPLRVKLAKLHGCRPENIIVGNGSDELLALATRAFVEPADSVRANPQGVALSTVQYFDPSYSLYPVLADIHGARRNPVSLPDDFSLPNPTELRRQLQWDFRAALTFITTPNAPSGRGYPTKALAAICTAQKGVVVLDEAYANFARENALALALEHPHVLVSRTFSKAYSLCFQRVGYFVGSAELIGAMHKIRDSYNVNGLGQIAAEATLDHIDYYQKVFDEITVRRDALRETLLELGFEAAPSETNFLLVRPPRFPAEEWRDRLRAAKILVRWFSPPNLRHYLRITIGSEREMAALVKAIHRILAKA